MQGRMDDANFGYREIAEALRRDISSGRIGVGNLLPTERELYSQFSVSRTTIRRALSDLVRTGWAVPEPNRGHIASHPNTESDSKLVAFIDHGSSTHQSLFFTLSQALTSQGYHVVHMNSEYIGTEGVLESLSKQGLYGAIVWSKTSLPELRRLRTISPLFKIVTVMHTIRGLEADHVQPKLFEHARSAVHHLYAHGARRIAVTGLLDGLHAHHDAFAGYLHACYELGVPTSPADFLFVRTSGQTEVETRHLKARLQMNDRPDAILMLQDMWVVEIVNAIREVGLTVPTDIALMGMGNDFPFHFEHCGLTTMAYDWDAAADLVTDLLLRPRTTSPRTPRMRHFGAILVPRGSAGEPTTEWSDYPYKPNRVGPVQSVPPNRAGQPTTDLSVSTTKW